MSKWAAQRADAFLNLPETQFGTEPAGNVGHRQAAARVPVECAAGMAPIRGRKEGKREGGGR